MRRAHAMPFGATPAAGGVRFRLWAPGAKRVEIALGDDSAALDWSVMPGTGGGWYEALRGDARPGTRYRYRLDGEAVVPDPASRHNPGDVHGASEVVDPHAFDWPDASWHGRPWHEAIVYELHVGTFSPEGTFKGVEQRLDHLATLGVTALELMPLADFPGARNWGYDGVLPFAPDATYGTPAELKSLVAAAHGRGMMVLLDVVYNHFGPEGNYLPRIAPPFFTERHHTPWGAALNFDGGESRPVRDFFLHNALYWLEEFHADGLRLDAVHAIVDDSNPDLLSELAQVVQQGPGRDRHVHLVLENDRNEAERLVRDVTRGPVHYTAQWNDDFHHVVHHVLTGEAAGYYADYAGDTQRHLGRALAEGFVYQGDVSAFRHGERRGEGSAHLPPEAFVNFIQNHDQVGNRAFGERIHTLAPAGALRAALALLLLAPATPLLFMGEEFGAATPFLFFCDFEPALADAVRRGRRAEFAAFPPFDDPAAAATIPDPGDEQTAVRSTLDWDSVGREAHAEWLSFYRDLLACRQRAIVPLLPHVVPGSARHRATGGVLDVRWPLDDGRALALQTTFGHARDAALPPAPPGSEPVWDSTAAGGCSRAVRWTIEAAARA